VLVEPGSWVSAGQVLATVDRSVQTQTAAQLAAGINVARADARIAQSELDRSQKLVARGFISQADIDRKTATRDAANARVAVAQAQLSETRARNGRLDIRSPAAGLVLTRAVEPGQIVSAGSGVLFRVAMGGQMEMMARMSENDLAAMPVGARAQVTPVGASRSYQGEVWQVSPVIDPQSRQGIARVALPYNLELRPGGFASATIVAGSREAPVLPESAVLNDERGAYVFLVGRDNKVARRQVTIGTVTSKGIAIVDGLNGTEQVVLRAGGFLNPGETVKPVRARANG
jgi:RND family efflux transporter MFP subunit